MIPASVRAFVAEKDGDGVVRQVRSIPSDDLGEGDVVVEVSWSGVNYKDGLATTATGRVARISPLVPGVDLAGTVADPGGSGLAAGAPVVVHGHDLGVAHHGGFAEYARVPSDWVVPLPEGLTERQAMTLGTAGFTAALSVHLLETRGGLAPGQGQVLVTGATGGVGSVAVGILAARGYEVAASTGKADSADWLRSLGANEVLDRAEIAPSGKPLDKERWAGAVDCVGGATLAGVLSTLRYGASVAASGNTGGVELATTVFPFILPRGQPPRRGLGAVPGRPAGRAVASDGRRPAPGNARRHRHRRGGPRRPPRGPRPGAGRGQPGPDPGARGLLSQVPGPSRQRRAGALPGRYSSAWTSNQKGSR